MSSERPTKTKFLDSVAEEFGVAVAILDDRGREVSVSNNNSICNSLWNSATHKHKCAMDCGMAFEKAAGSPTAAEYVCHAGLKCKAVLVSEKGTEFVAIIGRTFVRGENYRETTEKAISGEWSTFRPTEFFENILMTGSESRIDSAIDRLEKFVVRHDNSILEVDRPAKSVQTPENEIDQKINEFNKTTSVQVHQDPETSAPAAAEGPPDVSRWRSIFGSIMKMDYPSACRTLIGYLTEQFGFERIIWLDRRGDVLIETELEADMSKRAARIRVPAASDRLLASIKEEKALVLRERRVSDDESKGTQMTLIPVLVGNDVRSAFAVKGDVAPEVETDLFRFARLVGPQIEILRLRDEVSRRDWVSQGVKRFSDSLRRIDADDFWTHVTQISAELLQAERASLLVKNDKAEGLYAKAAIGSATDLKQASGLGNRIARHALEQGNPVVVRDMGTEGISRAPKDWRYKTSSFISFPILIGDRRIAVMNFTDRAGGDSFGERDVELLQTIAPQIAVAIDRTALKDRAGEFQQLSVTDSLTGLLNRRYLDERLIEEINRARRHRSEIALMMIDVDNFKSYNDSFGHPAGDLALKMVAAAMKETLRADDVAARFGGEEFAILLPRTNVEEAAAIAERIRSRVEHTGFQHRRITISIGIAGYNSEFETSKDWISAADLALYEAKHLGRNNVQIYDKMGRSFKERIN